MKKEGEIKIPSGCAVVGILSKEGKRIHGETIIRSIATMYDRSNGLGAYLDGGEVNVYGNVQDATGDTE